MTTSARTRRPVLWIIAAGLVAALVAGLYLFQPWRLFTTERVDEAVAVAPDGSQLVPIASGSFVSHEHSTSGNVELQQQPDGNAVVRIIDLRTSDGPALHVWLSDQPITGDGSNLDDGRYVDLGSLEGNEGNQNYTVPPGTDSAAFRTVVIWCERFSVSFGAAALTAR
ncbi:DM13 domain-containing protein [Nocardia sp. NPDC019395]|uniref:DM13 domain-containing protein n=1 Tax=Nocardia sp. NPDC019395 TaxID=3154686 RepID=UPI00340000AF